MRLLPRAWPTFRPPATTVRQPIQAPFKASTTPGPGGGFLQNFASGSGIVTQQQVTVPLGDAVSFDLQWNQPFQSLGGAGAASQINIYLLDNTGHAVAEGIDVVTGSDPMQEMQFFNDGSFGSGSTSETVFSVEIQLVSGPAPTMMQYVGNDDGSGFQINTFNTNSATDFGHPNAAGAIGVAAAPYFETPAFGKSQPQLENFSSEGGLPIYIDATGKLLSTPVIRQSPAVTGPDGVNTTFFAPTPPGTSLPSNPVPFNFFGTSAATPHVAAVAALMLQEAGGPGSLTPAQIRTGLENSATPIKTRVDPFNVSNTTPISPIPGPNGYNYYAGFGLVNADTAVGSVKPVGSGPTAVNDTATANGSTPVTITVLANDIAGASAIDPTTVTIVGQPTGGTISVNPVSGVVTYTANSNFSGTDVFTYTVSDTSGKVSNVAKVQVTVVTVVQPPTAVNDTATTDEDTPVAINVLANDVAGTNAIAPTSVSIVAQPNNGTVAVNPQTGLLTYTPNSGYFGADSFTYTVSDVNGNVSNVATVSITVNQFVPPVAVDDTVTDNENAPVTIAVLANDTPGTNPIDAGSVSIVASPSGGTLSVNPQTGVVTYTPSVNFFGSDSFTYTVSDTHGTVSNVAKVSITVSFVDQPPVALGDFAVTQPGKAVTIDVLANDHATQAPSSIVPSTLKIVQQPLNGTAQIVNNQIVYTPLAGFVGGDSFEYTVADNFSQTSNPATVAIRSGDAVSLSGIAYVDLNGDGIEDDGEVGIPNVTVELTKTDGNYKFTTFALTGANGAYHFVEGTNYILPAGVYNIKEIQPGFFVPGISTMGTPAAAGPNGNGEFDGITLAPDQQATGYDFGARTLGHVRRRVLQPPRLPVFGRPELYRPELAGRAELDFVRRRRSGHVDRHGPVRSGCGQCDHDAAE